MTPQTDADRTVAEIMRLAHEWAEAYSDASQTALESALRKLVEEASTLAAGQCIIDGGLVMGEYGNGVCTMQERAERAEAEAAALRKDAELWRQFTMLASEDELPGDEDGDRPALRAMVEAYTRYQLPSDRGYAQQETGMRLAVGALIAALAAKGSK